MGSWGPTAVSSAGSYSPFPTPHSPLSKGTSTMMNWLARLLPQPPTTKSLTAPCFAFDRLVSPAWAPRDYAAFAREGFMQNPVLYHAVRMIAEAAASVPLILYQGEDE